MWSGKRILAVVPARGGSKGVPLKNIHPLNGKPLIAWTAELLRTLPEIDRSVVSTDHPEIARVAELHGLPAPFIRPEQIAGDRIGDFEVLHHALIAVEELDALQYDIVLMLQPTSPLRRAEHVLQTVRALVEGNWDSVWTLSPTDLKYHPLKQLTLGPDGAMEFFDPRGSGIIARQQLAPVYHRNGASYALTRDCLLQQKTIKGARSTAVILDEPLVSIDTLEDFEKVGRLLSQRQGAS